MPRSLYVIQEPVSNALPSLSSMVKPVNNSGAVASHWPRPFSWKREPVLLVIMPSDRYGLIFVVFVPRVMLKQSLYDAATLPMYNTPGASRLLLGLIQNMVLH